MATALSIRCCAALQRGGTAEVKLPCRQISQPAGVATVSACWPSTVTHGTVGAVRTPGRYSPNRDGGVWPSTPSRWCHPSFRCAQKSVPGTSRRDTALRDRTDYAEAEATPCTPHTRKKHRDGVSASWQPMCSRSVRAALARVRVRRTDGRPDTNYGYSCIVSVVVHAMTETKCAHSTV